MPTCRFVSLVSRRTVSSFASSSEVVFFSVSIGFGLSIVSITGVSLLTNVREDDGFIVSVRGRFYVCSSRSVLKDIKRT